MFDLAALRPVLASTRPGRRSGAHRLDLPADDSPILPRRGRFFNVLRGLQNDVLARQAAIQPPVESSPVSFQIFGLERKKERKKGISPILRFPETLIVSFAGALAVVA